ncbi:MAG: ABC transporter permease [Chitinophagales bacterium]
MALTFFKKKEDGKTSVGAGASFPMLGYVLKRIFIFLPTLFIISLVTFMLIASAPGDPAESMLNQAQGEGQASDKLATEKAYQEVRHRIGLDLPVFYFQLTNAGATDTLNRISKAERRENLQRLNYDYGNWPQISKYYGTLTALEYNVLSIQKDSAVAGDLIEVRNLMSKLFYNYDDGILTYIMTNLDAKLRTHPEFSDARAQFAATTAAYSEMKQTATPWKRYIPAFKWHGTENQYHRWLFGNAKWFGEEEDITKSRGFLRGDFGISYFAKRPVSSMIWDGLRWTFIIALFSIVIQYLVSIPLGIFSARNKGTKADSSITVSLFILYSLPSFWIGTLLIIFLGGGDYFDLFPPFGLGDTTIEADGFWVRMVDLGHHLVLPLFCATYASFAFLSRQMRGSMMGVLRQDYIRTARAKGLDEKKVIWKHAFRNSLLPVITIFASVFPAFISGSLIIEYLFTIPGIGQTTYMAVVQKDYPYILTTTMFSAILTLVGYLVADILYAVVDPRISYSKK